MVFISRDEVENMEGEKEIEKEKRALGQDLKTKLKSLPLRNSMAFQKIFNPVEEDESAQPELKV